MDAPFENILAYFYQRIYLLFNIFGFENILCSLQLLKRKCCGWDSRKPPVIVPA